MEIIKDALKGAMKEVNEGSDRWGNNWHGIICNWGSFKRN